MRSIIVKILALFGSIVLFLVLLLPVHTVIIGGILALLLLVAFLLGTLLLAKTTGQKLGQLARSSSLPRPISRSLNESRYFAKLIVQMAQQCPPGPMQDRLNLTLKPVDQWLVNLNRLEQGLSKLYGQRNLARDLRQTSFEIDDLRRQLLTARGQEVSYLRDLKKSKEQHLAALKELERFQTQAELKIRKITSDLGATHAEMLLISARGDFNENRMRRLDENLQEHLASMRDVLAAMDEMGYGTVASSSY
jgi:hypothetical protein